MLAICANLCRCVLSVSLCLQKFLIRLHLLWKISRSFYKKTCIFFEKSLPYYIDRPSEHLDIYLIKIAAELAVKGPGHGVG